MTADRTCGRLINDQTHRPCLRPPGHKNQCADAIARAVKKKRNKNYYRDNRTELLDQHNAHWPNYYAKHREERLAAKRSYRKYREDKRLKRLQRCPTGSCAGGKIHRPTCWSRADVPRP